MKKIGIDKEVFLSNEVAFWIERIKNINEENIYMYAQILANAEESKQLLRNKGYGWTGLDLLGTIKEVPENYF